MSYIEFQISVPAFLGAQQNALRAMKNVLCSPVPIPVGQVQIVLDRIDFGNNAVRHNQETTYAIFYEDHGGTQPTPNTPSGFKTQIAQDITVHVSALNDILLRPNQPPLISVPFTGTLVFDLDFFSLVDDCYIRLQFTSFEPGSLPFLPPNFDIKTIPLPITVDQLLAAVNQRLSSAIPARTLPAGLGTLSKGVKFLNAGVSIDSQLQFLAFRTQVGGSSSSLDVPWGNFFHGFIANRLQGRDWALTIDAGYIETALQTQVEQALAKVHVDHLQTFPGSHYSHPDGRVIFTTDVLAIYDLPDPLGHAKSDPKLTIELSITTANWMTIDIDLSEVIDDSDFYVKMAEDFLLLLGIPVESILQALIGSAAIDFLATSTPLENCKPLSPTHIQCQNSVRLPQVPGAVQTVLTSLLAFDDAISLAGTLNIQPLSLAALSTTVHTFQKVAPSVTCGPASMALIAGFQDDPSGFRIFHNQGFIENTGTAPLYLCNMTVVNDSLGAFPLANIRADSDRAFITINLDMPIPPEGYYKNPYPCDLLVQTSAGTRLLRFGNLPVATREDIDALAAALLVEIGNCEQLIDPWFHHHQGYNPAWSPRPPEGLTVDHLWQVEISGLRAGETVSVINTDGQEVMQSTARAGTPMRLSAMITPGGEKELSIQKTVSPVAQSVVMAMPREYTLQHGQDGRDHTQGIAVGQTLLIQIGSLPLPGECLRLLPFRLATGPCVLAVMDGGLSAYSFDDPQRPLPVCSWQIDGLRGALNWQAGLLYYGEEGFGRLDRQGNGQDVPADCAAQPVLAAAAGPQGVYSISEQGLEIYSRRFCRTSLTPLDGARSVLRLGGVLAVGGRAGLVIYDPSDARQPRSLSTFDGLDVVSLQQALGLGPRSFLALLADGCARAFAWNGNALEQTASFNLAPWFANSLRLGDLLIRIAPGRRHLDLYRFGESQAL